MLHVEQHPAATEPLTPPRRFGPGWPLRALLVYYPLWWAIGLGPFAFIVFAVPMTRQLMRQRPVRLPPWFGLWLLFLLWNVISLVMLPLTPSGTTAGSISGRSIAITVNLLGILAATVALLYVGNLDEEQVPQSTLLRWQSGLFLVTALGGVLGMVAPHFSFTSPIEAILPHSISSNAYAKTFVHPVSAQNQNVFGYETPRPAAPWAYTNFWGNNISILLVWFVIYQFRRRGTRERVLLVGGLLVAVITVVYSLNRGVWFGLLLSVAYVIVHVARRGDVRATLAVLMLIPIAAIALFVTPLHSVLSQRASHGQSNDIRSFLDHAAWRGATESPIIGWGGTRKAIGSAQSIAIGPSPDCPSCGGVSIGSTGELWAVMFDQGLVGTALYFGFFLAILMALRRDDTAIGAGARLIVILGIFYTLFYNNVPSALTLTMIAIAMSWRGLHTRAAEAVAPVAVRP